jgi:threonine/homoserine/homoserine lactone efflux protein
MFWIALKLGVIYGLIVSAIALGPSFFSIIQTSLRKGWQYALALDLGIIFSDLVCIALAYWGASSLLTALESNVYVYPVAGLILIAYGVVKLLTRKQKETEKGLEVKSSGYLKYFFKGFFVNIINPGLLFYWFTVVGIGFENLRTTEGSELYLLEMNMLFNATLLGVVFAVDLMKIFFAGKLKSILKPNILSQIDLLVSLIFMGIGVYFINKSFWENLVHSLLP